LANPLREVAEELRRDQDRSYRKEEGLDGEDVYHCD
jgi:hypothetical protein